MTELLARLYLDEDVDVLVARLLRARGYEATTTLETGNRGHTDPDQLAFAAAAGLVILTHNRIDFETLAADWLGQNRSHAGIIIAVQRPAHDIVRRLLILLNHVSGEEFIDQVRYI